MYKVYTQKRYELTQLNGKSLNLEHEYNIVPMGYILREEASIKKETGRAILERYFNDLYKLFLTKLSQFDCTPNLADSEKRKLKMILDELIEVKVILSQEENENNYK